MSDQIRQDVVDGAVKAIVRHSAVIADSLGLDWTPAELRAVYQRVGAYYEAEQLSPSLTMADWLTHLYGEETSG